MMRFILLIAALVGCDTAVPYDDDGHDGDDGNDVPADRQLDDDDDDDDAVIDDLDVPGVDVDVDLVDCEDFVTPGHNDCNGHTDFSIHLLDSRDADGDGVWEVGETIELDVRFHSVDEHMWYPGMLLDSSSNVGAPELVGFAPEWWYYGIFADGAYTETFTFTADGPGTAEMVITAALLNCDGNAPCPHPSPLVVTGEIF